LDELAFALHLCAINQTNLTAVAILIFVDVVKELSVKLLLYPIEVDTLSIKRISLR